MGMDLLPINDSCPPHHFNWTGWRTIASLLEDAGANLDQMAHSNDGDVVTAPTASAWADALENALDNLIVVQIEDPAYTGGIREHFRVLSAQVRNPVQPVDDFLEAMYTSDMRHLVEQRVEHLRSVTPTIREATDDDKDWLRSFVTFLRNSGGFHQC